MSKKCLTAGCENPLVTALYCKRCLGIKPHDERIENNFKYHSPREGQPEKYTAIREKAKELAYLIDELCPNSREKSLATTKIEEATMWANASIARNE